MVVIFYRIQQDYANDYAQWQKDYQNTQEYNALLEAKKNIILLTTQMYNSGINPDVIAGRIDGVIKGAVVSPAVDLNALLDASASAHKIATKNNARMQEVIDRYNREGPERFKWNYWLSKGVVSQEEYDSHFGNANGYIVIYYLSTTVALPWTLPWSYPAAPTAPYLPPTALPQDGGTARPWEDNIVYNKPSKSSSKEKKNDVPNWARGERPNPEDKDPKDFARRLMDDKYGPGRWKEGPGREYNKIKKWAEVKFY